MVIKIQIEVNAQLEKTFQIFTDLDNMNKYIVAITDIKILNGSGYMRNGSKWIQTRETMGETSIAEMSVTLLEENKLFEVSYNYQNIEYRMLYTFFDFGGQKTMVDLVFESEAYGFFARLLKPMNRLFKAAFTKDLEKDLKDLKKAAEEQQIQLSVDKGE